MGTEVDIESGENGTARVRLRPDKVIIIKQQYINRIYIIWLVGRGRGASSQCSDRVIVEYYMRCSRALLFGC